MIDQNIIQQSIAHYSGNGQLAFEDKIFIGAFDAIQLADGDIHLFLSLDAHNYALSLVNGAINFIGKTSDDKALSLSGYAFHRTINHQINDDVRKSIGHFRFSGETYLKVEEDIDKVVESIYFGITNLEFTGNEFEKVESNKNSLNKLVFSLDGKKITFKKLSDYDGILKQMKQTTTSNVTCELKLEIETEFGIERAKEFVSVICNLLTIAKGKKVNWIYYKIYDSSSQLLAKEHQPRVTSGFAGVELIDDIPAKNLVDFIQVCYPNYINLDSKFNFQNIVNAYTDTRSKGFLETRCLALFSLVDYLVHKSSKERALRKRIDATISEFKVPIDDDDILNYIESRNSLVHEMAFHTTSPRSEYFDNLHFLDRMLLRILGYEGYYINVTKLPHISGSQTDKLVP